jgi:hypothetical protein
MDLTTVQLQVGSGSSPAATPTQSVEFQVINLAMVSDVPASVADGHKPTRAGTFLEVFTKASDTSPAFTLPVGFGFGVMSGGNPGHQPKGPANNGQLSPLSTSGRVDLNTSKLLTATLKGKSFGKVVVVVRQPGSTGVVTSTVTMELQSALQQSLRFSEGGAGVSPSVSIDFSGSSFKFTNKLPPAAG